MNDQETDDLLDIKPVEQPAQSAEPPKEAEEPEEQVLPNIYLDLSASRMDWLVTRACERIENCRNKMGLKHGQSMATPGSWAWDRQVAQLQYDGVFDWRRDFGGIFLENNWSLNVPKRFIRLMSAKICSDLLGTEPYFAAMPEKAEDAILSKQVESRVQKEVSASNLTEVLKEAVRVAIAGGERAVMVSHVRDITKFKGPAVVAVDAQGNPFKTPSGDYIFPKDDFIPDPNVQGQNRLKKEPDVVANIDSAFIDPQTGSPRFSRVNNLVQTVVHKDGLEAGSIQTEDFLWDINVSELQKSDIMVRVYDETEENLKKTWGKLTKNPRFALSADGMSQASQPIQQMGEQKAPDPQRPMVNVHEVYIRCDADEDDADEWIFMVLDYQSREAIYCEYLSNLKIKEPPFVLIRGVESVPGRAYGNGVYKMFDQKNLFIDIQFNRVALKASKDGSVTFVHKDGTEQSKAGLQITIGGKDQYTIPATAQYNKDNPPIFRVNLNEVDEKAIELMEKMIQTGMLEFGIVSGADGSESDLNSSRTATGVRNIERTGNLLHRMTEDMIADDIERVLEISTDIILENLDEEESEYDPDSSEIVKLNRDEIRLLPRDVRLLLTKMRSEEAIQTSTQVTALMDAYYARPMWLRKKVRPEYIAQLKMLEVQDADDRLEEPTDEQIQQEAQANSSKGQAIKAQESMKLTPDILMPSEIAQLIQTLGITPDPSRLQPQPQTVDTSTTQIAGHPPRQPKIEPPSAPTAAQLATAPDDSSKSHA